LQKFIIETLITMIDNEAKFTAHRGFRKVQYFIYIVFYRGVKKTTAFPFS